MVQKANNTQELHETSVNAAKNVTKVVAINASKESKVQVKANKTTEAIKNSTIQSVSDKNKTALSNKTASLPQPVASNKPTKSAVKVDTNNIVKPVQTLS